MGNKVRIGFNYKKSFVRDRFRSLVANDLGKDDIDKGILKCVVRCDKCLKQFKYNYDLNKKVNIRKCLRCGATIKICRDNVKGYERI
jgi:heterodisulfide reductase subunit A-like polyferredoxin